MVGPEMMFGFDGPDAREVTYDPPSCYHVERAAVAAIAIAKAQYCIVWMIFNEVRVPVFRSDTPEQVSDRYAALRSVSTPYGGRL